MVTGVEHRAESPWRVALEKATQHPPVVLEDLHHRWIEGAPINAVDLELLIIPAVVGCLVGDARFTPQMIVGVENALRRLAADPSSRKGTPLHTSYRRCWSALSEVGRRPRKPTRNASLTTEACRALEAGEPVRLEYIELLELVFFDALNVLRPPRGNNPDITNSAWELAIKHTTTWWYATLAASIIQRNRQPLGGRLEVVVRSTAHSFYYHNIGATNDATLPEAITAPIDSYAEALAQVEEARTTSIPEVIEELLSDFAVTTTTPIHTFRTRGQRRAKIILDLALQAYRSDSPSELQSQLMNYFSKDERYGAFMPVVSYLRRTHPEVAGSDDGVRQHLEKLRKLVYDRILASSDARRSSLLVLGTWRPGPIEAIRALYIRRIAWLSLATWPVAGAAFLAVASMFLILSSLRSCGAVEAGTTSGGSHMVEALRSSPTGTIAIAPPTTRAAAPAKVDRPIPQIPPSQLAASPLWKTISSERVSYSWPNSQSNLRRISRMAVDMYSLVLEGEEPGQGGVYCDGAIWNSDALIRCRSWWEGDTSQVAVGFLLATIRDNCGVVGYQWFLARGPGFDGSSSTPRIGHSTTFQLYRSSCQETSWADTYPNHDPVSFVTRVCRNQEGSDDICATAIEWIRDGIAAVQE